MSSIKSQREGRSRGIWDWRKFRDLKLDLDGLRWRRAERRFVHLAGMQSASEAVEGDTSFKEFFSLLWVMWSGYEGNWR